jgi:glutamate carboxypeptidase
MPRLAQVRSRGLEMLAQTRSCGDQQPHGQRRRREPGRARCSEAFALPSLANTTIPGGEAYGDHLVWRTAAPGAPILLVGHHDTVFPPGHFEGWREDGNRATGPGVLDMKGGLAVIGAALAALDEVGVLSRIPVIVVVSVSDEEVGRRPGATPVRAATGAACPGIRVRPRERYIITRRKGVAR